MSKDQMLTVEGLLEWKNDLKIVYASNYGKGQAKQLASDLNGNYLVYHHKEMVLQTALPQLAIEKYNSL